MRHLGYFEDEVAAAHAYDRAVLELRGPGAATNFRAEEYNAGAGALLLLHLLLVSLLLLILPSAIVAGCCACCALMNPQLSCACLIHAADPLSLLSLQFHTSTSQDPTPVLHHS